MRGIDSRLAALEKLETGRKEKVCTMFWDKMTYDEKVLWKKWAEAYAHLSDWVVSKLESAQLLRSSLKLVDCIEEVYSHYIPELFPIQLADFEMEYNLETTGTAHDRINRIADFEEEGAENEQFD